VVTMSDDGESEVPGPTRGEPVVGVSGPGVAVRGDDVDTDQIVPARFLKAVTFDDMAGYAFHDERAARDDHPFDRPEHRDARVLVVNDNFGCGSSREHAPQALLRWGIRAVVGESFAEIFADNCTSIGVPTVTADPETVADLQSFVEADPDAVVRVDLDDERVRYGDATVAVGVDPSAREALVAGDWDTTAVMRTNVDRVRETARSLPYATVADANGDSETGDGRDANADVGTETNADAETDPNADPETDTETDTGTDPETDADSNTETDTITNPETETDTSTDPEVGTDTDTDTNTDAAGSTSHRDGDRGRTDGGTPGESGDERGGVSE